MEIMGVVRTIWTSSTSIQRGKKMRNENL